MRVGGFNICSLVSSEPKSTLGDGESITILKEDSASGQFRVTPSDEKDGNSNGTPGTLLIISGNYIDTADAVVMSETRFGSDIAYEWNADTSAYLEHWVPASISELQREIYCSIMLSNSSVLQSQTETDSVGALRQIITSLLKCCDDPCLVGEFPQRLAVVNNNRTETIDARVHSCGKLLLLEKMLKEIRNNRLRVIILFQSGGAAGNPVGDILEGVVHHRFGRESYERVEDSSAISSKKAAVNMFNEKSKGRFVFLIESRSCLSNIELSSIDAIIIYNSDWNPLNDLKALQRIKIESQFKYASIFRLYTPFTMEEKRLVLAKEGMPITNIRDITCSVSHSLISWVPSFLFSGIYKLQRDNYASKSSERDTHFMDKVISEFVTRLPINVEDNNKINSAFISRANMSGEYYSRNITLIGEKERIPALDGDPSKFWLHLLDGKSPCWSYISEPSKSGCRMLQNMEELAKVPPEEAGEARRKRIKIDGNHAISSPAPQLLDDGTRQNSGETKLLSTPKNLHLKIKQELSELMKALQLPDNVRLVAEQLLQYMLENHLVVLEPAYILQAFNITLCCRAASFLKHQLDRKELLAIAKQCLGYECNEELIAFMYGKLRTLKKEFPRRAGETSIKCLPTTVEGTKFSSQETSTDNFKNGAPLEGSYGAEQMISEPISAQAMQNEPVKTSVDSAGGQTCDPANFPESSIRCSSDGIGLPRAGCSSSVIPANDGSIGQESLTGEHRNTEHVERDNIANPSIVLGGTISVVKGVSASNDGTPDTNQVRLELPILSSSIPMRDDQPAEAEGILDVVTAQDLQPEMQPLTSTQDVPSESIPIHQSAGPSLDPHAGVESAHTPGVVRAHDLQSEIQPSVSMQDQPAEAGSDVLGTIAARGLQPEMRSSTTEQYVPHERTHSEKRRQDGFLPNMAPCPGQPTQLPQEVPTNEHLDRLNRQYTLLKGYEQKRSLFIEAYNQELKKVNVREKDMEKIKSEIGLKYGSLLLELKNIYLQHNRELDDKYMKDFVNQSVAEDFPRMFRPSSASQGGVIEQQLDSSSATQTSVSPVISSSDILLPAGPYVRPSLVAQPSSSRTVHPQPTIPSNLYGDSTSSPFVPASVLHGSFGAQPHAVQPQPILPGNLYRTMSPLSLMTSYRPTGPQLQQHSMRPPYVASMSSHFFPASVPHGSFGAQPHVVQPQPILPGNLYRTMSPLSMMTSYRSTGEQLRAPTPQLQQLSMRPPYVASTSSPFVPASVPHGSFGAQPRAVQPQPILPVNLYRAMSPPSMMTSYRSTGAQLRAPAPHLEQLSMRPPCGHSRKPAAPLG